MLRRISTSSIIISLVALMLISASAFAQTGDGKKGIILLDFNGGASGDSTSAASASTDDEYKGIILLDFAGGGGGGTQTSGATIWAQSGADAEGATQTVSYTVSDGTQLRGIILLDLHGGAGGGTQTSGATIWAQSGASVAGGTDGSSARGVIIFTDYTGTPKGVAVRDSKVRSGLKGIILLDGRVVSVGGSAAGQTSELSIVGSDGTQMRGIILLDLHGGAGGGTQTSGATIWAQSGASVAGGTDGGKIVKVVDESGAFLGLLYLGDGPAPFKGFVFGGR
jgi:hypothetical protein